MRSHGHVKQCMGGSPDGGQHVLRQLLCHTQLVQHTFLFSTLMTMARSLCVWVLCASRLYGHFETGDRVVGPRFPVGPQRTTSPSKHSPIDSKSFVVERKLARSSPSPTRTDSGHGSRSNPRSQSSGEFCASTQHQ